MSLSQNIVASRDYVSTFELGPFSANMIVDWLLGIAQEAKYVKTNLRPTSKLTSTTTITSMMIKFFFWQTKTSNVRQDNKDKK
jgi:hypothetical protein